AKHRGLSPGVPRENRQRPPPAVPAPTGRMPRLAASDTFLVEHVGLTPRRSPNRSLLSYPRPRQQRERGKLMSIIHPLRRTAVVIAFGLIPLSLRPDTKPLSAKEDVSRLPAESAQLYADTTLFPREAKYQQIPW